MADHTKVFSSRYIMTIFFSRLSSQVKQSWHERATNIMQVAAEKTGASCKSASKYI